MALFREQADVSVRPAVAEDGPLVAATQISAWRATHQDTLGPEVLDALDADAMRQQWLAAVVRPPTGLHRVLVACDGADVVGFAAIGPIHADERDVDPGTAGDDAGADGDAPTHRAGEVLALEVHPDHRRSGHGSRLLAAAVDHFRSAEMTALTTWVLDGDLAREQFLRSAGLGPDGVARELATGPRTVNEHRWVAEI